MLQYLSTQQCNSVEHTAQLRNFTGIANTWRGFVTSVFPVCWVMDRQYEEALRESLIHDRAFWRQNTQEQSLRRWITLACPPPFNFHPYPQSELKNSPVNCLKACWSLKTSFKGLETMCLHRAISKESHKGFQTVVWSCLQPAPREEVLKDQVPAVWFAFISVSFSRQLSDKSHICLEGHEAVTKKIQDLQTLPRNRNPEILNIISNSRESCEACWKQQPHVTAPAKPKHASAPGLCHLPIDSRHILRDSGPDSLLSELPGDAGCAAVWANPTLLCGGRQICSAPFTLICRAEVTLLQVARVMHKFSSSWKCF